MPHIPKLVILDRDGVINLDSDQFIKSPDEWIAIEGSLEAIAELNQAGYQVVVATNQSGIGRGLFEAAALNAMHEKMYKALASQGGRVDAVFFCPHTAAEGCDCRKPKAGMFREIARRFDVDLAGVPVVGVDSLRYFWTPRTPASAAADMDRLVRFYAARWKKTKALLIGYSQGADVLPFIVNRLPAASREHVALAVMMGLGKRADFEFHMTNWVSSSASGLLILPEVQKLPTGLGMCIYGRDEKDSNCPSLDPKQVQLVKLPGGHHFDGDYAKLARIILEGARGPGVVAR